MTPIADMIEQMYSENAPLPAILAAVRSMERVTAVTRDKVLQSRVTKRDGNKKRQAARRERLKLQALAAEAQANDGVTASVTVTRDSVTPHCESKKEDSLSVKVGKKKESKKVRSIEDTRARGTRMEPGALLTESFREEALALGALPEEVPGAWAEFVDYWIGIPGSRGAKSDWPATWRNRIRDILKRGNRNGTGTGPNRANSATGQSGSAAIIAGVAEATERRARERAGPLAERPAGPVRPGHAAEGTDLELFGARDG